MHASSVGRLAKLSSIIAVFAVMTSCSQEQVEETPTADAPATEASSGEVSTAEATPIEASTDGLVERGAYLALGVAGCHGCHSEAALDPEATVFPLSGMHEGAFVAPNITQDVETGIGGWSDAEIVTALRTGITPGGKELHPVMPWKFYASMTEDDMRALIAWLRTQEPVSNKLEPVEIAFPAELFVDPPAVLTADTAGESVANGSYLSAMAHCLICHTPPGPEGKIDYVNQLGAGGFPMGPPDGQYPSANLTPHAEDGIAHYSDEEVAGLIQTGMRADGTALRPPMGPHGMTDSDVMDLVAFLRQLEPKPMGIATMPDLEMDAAQEAAISE